MKKKGNSIVGKIARKAKAIRKTKESWKTAIKRAAKLVTKS
jgi:hypothetical protein